MKGYWFLHGGLVDKHLFQDGALDSCSLTLLDEIHTFDSRADRFGHEGLFYPKLKDTTLISWHENPLLALYLGLESSLLLFVCCNLDRQSQYVASTMVISDIGIRLITIRVKELCVEGSSWQKVHRVLNSTWGGVCWHPNVAIDMALLGCQSQSSQYKTNAALYQEISSWDGSLE